MIHSVKFTCVLDTNIIYPIEIRDLLFWFAHYELYTPKWSIHIFDEWKEIMARNNVPEDEILKRVEMAIKAFRKLVMNRRNPDLDEYQVLNAFRRNGLTETANYLHALL